MGCDRISQRAALTGPAGQPARLRLTLDRAGGIETTRAALPPSPPEWQLALAGVRPVVLEQLLNSIMGTADTMMVSNVGSAAISAVSLVDSINVLVIQAFSALAAGGAIVCAQYIGQKNKEKAITYNMRTVLAFLSKMYQK